MAKIKLTRSQMALASGESLEDFDKRTDGKDPTSGIELGGSSQFFESPGSQSDEPADDEPANDVLVDDQVANDEIDQSQYLPDDDDEGDTGKDTGKKKPAKAEVPDWADDDAREFAASYGLKDADLGNFKTVDDLYEYGRATDSSIAQGEKGEKGDSSDKTKPDKTKTDPGMLDRLKPLDRQKFVDAKYGDEELQLVDGLNATIEAMREIFPSVHQQRTAQQQESESREAQEFNKALDEMSPNTFGRAVSDGKIGELSEGFLRNRLKVHEAMERLANGIADDQKREGKEVKLPSVRILAQRAAALAFPVSTINESDAAGYRASAEAVAKQSRRRRPTSSVGKRGVSSGTVGKSTPKDDARSILSNPAVQQFWKRTQRENGAD